MLLPGRLKGCRVKHRDAGRNGLDGLIAQQRRGHDHFLQTVTGRFGGIISMRQRGCRCRQQTK
jgi:hypothetical protein